MNYLKSKSISLIICLVVILSCKKNESIQIGENIYELAFSDEFNESVLNESVWDYRTDSKHWSTQKKENVEIKDGYLYLNLKKEKALDKEYTGSGLISKQTFKYGYYEAKLKVPNGAGWHTSFWLMAHDGLGGTNTDVATIEIDILENDSKDKNGYHVNLHKWYDGHVDYKGQHVKADGLNRVFQVLACEYTPEFIKYYLNGNEVRHIDISDLKHSSLNIWLTSIASFLGRTEKVDNTKLPSSAMFDYVRYYKAIE